MCNLQFFKLLLCNDHLNNNLSAEILVIISHIEVIVCVQVVLNIIFLET